MLYISIHRYEADFYPNNFSGSHERIGQGKGEGYNIHFPFLKKGRVADNEYIYACESLFFPIISEFNPDLIMISAGFDAANGDVLGKINVSPVGFAWMT